jgi:hypothetical protein
VRLRAKRPFQVLPRRWVAERTLSWITRHRRTVRDYERLAAHHEPAPGYAARSGATQFLTSRGGRSARDGTRLATGSDDRTMGISDIAINHHQAVCWTFVLYVSSGR